MVVAGKTYLFGNNITFTNGTEGESGYWTVINTTLTINFTSNNTSFTSMLPDNNGEEFYYDSTNTWDYNSGSGQWLNAAYRTITFDSSASAVTGAWESFLQYNTIEITSDTTYLVSSTDLTSVANAIRTKGGTSASLVFPTGFVSAINSIEGGYDYPDGYAKNTTFYTSSACSEGFDYADGYAHCITFYTLGEAVEDI